MDWAVIAAASLIASFVTYTITSSRHDLQMKSAERDRARAVNILQNEFDDLSEKYAISDRERKQLLRKLRKLVQLLNETLGETIADLQQVRDNAPSWLNNRDDFLLMSPGSLHEIYHWARRGGLNWKQLEKLSPQARRTLEEICLHRSNTCPTIAVEHSTPLLTETIDILAKKPAQIETELLHLSSDQFLEFAQWARELAAIGQKYILRVWAIEPLAEQMQSVQELVLKGSEVARHSS